MCLNFIDNFQNMNLYRITSLQLCPHFGPCFTASDPTRAAARLLYFAFPKPFRARYFLHSGNTNFSADEGSRQKDIVMTFDCERYREYLAPLKLPHEQEDKLLKDLWMIAETLVDQSLSSPTFPQQFALACSAFSAVDEAVAVESRTQQLSEKQEEL